MIQLIIQFLESFPSNVLINCSASSAQKRCDYSMNRWNF